MGFPKWINTACRRFGKSRGGQTVHSCGGPRGAGPSDTAYEGIKWQHKLRDKKYISISISIYAYTEQIKIDIAFTFRNRNYCQPPNFQIIFTAILFDNSRSLA